MTPEELNAKLDQMLASQRLLQDGLQMLIARQIHVEARLQAWQAVELELLARTTGAPAEMLQKEILTAYRAALRELSQRIGIELERESFSA